MEIPVDTILESKRCLLRCVSDADADYYWEVLHYPGFTDGLLVNSAKSKEEVVQWIKDDLAAWGKSKKFAFTVQSKEGEFLGRINIREVHNNGTWNMGFWILPSHWGRGYAAEAASTVIEFAFERLNAKKICAAHTQTNIQSKRVIEKIGMRFVENKEKGFLKNSKWVANTRYEITRENRLFEHASKQAQEEV